MERRGAVCTCDTSARDPPTCVCVCVGEEGGGGSVRVCVESAWGSVGTDPFRLPRCCTATTRDDYKVLQLLQSGRSGEHANTDFVCTEI